MRSKELDDDELALAIAELGDRPLGAGGEGRVSLAGQQPKLILARTADGRWGRPAHGSPSTLILKPQDQRLPDSAYNEAACVNTASAPGLGVVGLPPRRPG